MTALSVSNFVIMLTVPMSSTIASILTPVLRASFSVIGSRIVLNLRSVAAPELANSALALDDAGRAPPKSNAIKFAVLTLNSTAGNTYQTTRGTI